MTREWILQVLNWLPVRLWPVFLWDLVRLRAWWHALPIKTDTLLTFGVTARGRIIVAGLYEGGGPPETEWTRYAPRAPWRAQCLDAAAAAFAALCHLNVPRREASGLFPDPAWTVTGPDFLDSG